MYVSRSKRTFEIARFARRTFYIEAVIARAGFFGISLAARLSASLRPVNFGHAHTLCETAGQNIDMKKHIVRQNYFLTNSYHGGVSEVDLYRGFLLRCFCDMQRFDIEIAVLRNDMRRKYGINMSLFVLESILKKLANEYPELILLDGKVSCRSLPKALVNEASASVQSYDEDIRKLHKAFNAYLKDNKYKGDLSISSVQALVEQMHAVVLDATAHLSDLPVKDKLFFEWVQKTLRNENPVENYETLNRILYAAFAHHYFTEFKVPNAQIHKVKVHLDTNILAFAVGVAGKTRRLFALELLELLAANKIVTVISCETTRELSELIVRGTAPAIKLFRLDNPDLSTQLISNTQSALISVLGQQLPNVEWDNTALLMNKASFGQWGILFSDLANFKRQRRPEKDYADFSFDHDINLIHSAGAFGPTANVYEQKAVIVTGDNLLANWFEGVLQKVFQAQFCPVIPVEQFAYFLWFEGNQQQSGSFMANAWLYLIDNIPFFRKDSLNNIYKILTELPESKTVVPNYRSTYLLVLHKLANDDPEALERMSEEEFITGLKGLGEDLSSAITTLATVSQELATVKRELSALKPAESPPPPSALRRQVAEILEWISMILRAIRKIFWPP